MNNAPIDPKVGDHAAVTLNDGATVSCTVTHVNDKAVQFEWAVGPRTLDKRWIRIVRSALDTRVKLFPPGSKFLAV